MDRTTDGRGTAEPGRTVWARAAWRAMALLIGEDAVLGIRDADTRAPKMSGAAQEPGELGMDGLSGGGQETCGASEITGEMETAGRPDGFATSAAFAADSPEVE
ncbi:hypothetical protein [Alicyclobacillus sp.]|uniref:hypothetical protein n=1 Tax=Alicyclobacillus sp. TaxID=61169 RepID=UPI0025B85164|nr:hypothetical protein [Alicyclobacillus sp.]MCL6517852.1 hypothetical protein [Alicyclobacillus sp.]